MSKSERAVGVPARPWRILTLAALALATCVAFEGVLSNGWILLDDPLYVTDDIHVRSGFTWEGFTWFLGAIHVGNWHPLTSWSHMLDVEFFGLSPRGPHAVSLALHVVNACLLLSVLAKLTGQWWRSTLVAAFFALHPLRVESVAWISERKDVLSAFFFFSALWAYQRWVEHPTRLRQAALLGAFMLGLMAKPMLVTLPFVLVLIDVWPLCRVRLDEVGAWKRALWSRIVEKWPLFALSFVSSVVTLVVQSESGATSNLQRLPLVTRLSTAITGCVTYVWKTFVPTDLAVFYPHTRTGSLASSVLGLLGLAAVTLACLLFRRTRPVLSVGWLWFMGTLVPVIGIVQVGAQSHADRYTYVPTIGLAILVVWGVFDSLAEHPRWLKVSVLAGCASLMLLVPMTRAQVQRWRTTRTLFAHTLAVTVDNAVAEKVYADALLADGDTDDAIVHFERALNVRPAYPEARKNLGCALGLKGRIEEAVVQFREAAKGQPTRDNLFNLGCSLSDVHEFEESIDVLRRALVIAPDDVPVNARLGKALAYAGRFDEAVLRFRHAVECQPGDIDSRRNLAITLTIAGDVEGAIACYRRLLESNPDDVDSLNNIAWIRSTHPDAAHRNGAEAVMAAERARDRSAEPVAVLFSTLAAAYGEAGRFDDAVAAATRAVELAQNSGDVGLAQRFREQLETYRAHKPLRLP